MNLSRYFKEITQVEWQKETAEIRQLFNELGNLLPLIDTILYSRNSNIIKQLKEEKKEEISKIKDFILPDKIVSSINSVLQDITNKNTWIRKCHLLWIVFKESNLRLIEKGNRFRSGKMEKAAWSIAASNYNFISIWFNQKHFASDGSYSVKLEWITIAFYYSVEEEFYWCRSFGYGERRGKVCHFKCDDFLGFSKFIQWNVEEVQKNQK